MKEDKYMALNFKVFEIFFCGDVYILITLAVIYEFKFFKLGLKYSLQVLISVSLSFLRVELGYDSSLSTNSGDSINTYCYDEQWNEWVGTWAKLYSKNGIVIVLIARARRLLMNSSLSLLFCMY